MKTSSESRVKSDMINKIVFVFAISIVTITYVSIFFPALIPVFTAEQELDMNPFEPGTWAIPFLFTNIAILFFGLAFRSGKLPAGIKKGIDFILSFEVSKKGAIIVILVLIGIYIGFSAHEITLNEEDEWEDFSRIRDVLRDFPDSPDASQFMNSMYVKNSLLYVSEQVFQNIKIVPFLGSISLLLITYLFTAKVAKKRFAGLIALAVLLQTHTFLRFDTLATYTNFWTLFYLLSLYLIYTKWYISPASSILSILSKALSATFLPMTMFFIYRVKMPKRKKYLLVIMYIGIIVILAASALALGILSEGTLTLDYERFWSGFTVFSIHLRFDSFAILFLYPLIVGLFLLGRRRLPEASSISILLSGMLLLTPLLGGLTDYNLHPYRLIPLLVFFSVGIGILFSASLNRNINSKTVSK